MQGHTRLTSLDEVSGCSEDGEALELHDILASNQEDPATKAARKMDWEDFYSGLSAMDQAIIQSLTGLQGQVRGRLSRAFSYEVVGDEEPLVH